MSPSAAQPQSPQSFGIKTPLAYEFEKRKRWADLLLTELVDNVPFILSPTCKIWFCGIAVTEILGWRDVDLVDLDFINLVDITDQDRFRTAFQQAMDNNIGFDISIRLKASDGPLSYPNLKSSKTAVFDFKSRPHIITPATENESETKCLIAMVSPYPSRNTAMLNTMLDLKTQNERLQRRVAEYRERAPPGSPTSGQSPSSSQAGSMYATSSLHHARKASISGPLPPRTVALPSTYLSSSSTLSRSLDGPMGSTAEGTDFSSAYSSGSANADDQGDEGSKKKKLKRAQNAEQYVCITCGRTDSPEWRKGPLGPKTLCNACGLRWAKQMRKVDDPAGENNVNSSSNAEN